jgi:hypothetical protein
MISGMSCEMDFLKMVAGVLSFGLPLGLPDIPGLNFDCVIC